MRSFTAASSFDRFSDAQKIPLFVQLTLIINGLGFFSNQKAITPEIDIITSVTFGILSLIYAAYIIWKVKKQAKKACT